MVLPVISREINAVRHIELNLKRNIIRRAALKQRTGLSDATIWRYERDDKFPKRVALSDSGIVGWFEDEIDQWIADRVRAAGKRPMGVAPAKRKLRDTVSSVTPANDGPEQAIDPTPRRRGRSRATPPRMPVAAQAASLPDAT
jgi:prophage regulatory protein